MIPLAARPRLVHARLRRRGDQVFLLAPERGLLLGGCAAAVLVLVDGRRTVGQIIAELNAAYVPGEPDAIRRDVLSLLESLGRKRLLRIDPS